MDTIAIGTIATLAGLVAVTISPIIRLNTLITKLNATIEMLIRDGEKRNHRLDVHSDRLDSLEHTVTEHGVKIDRLSEYHPINAKGGR